MKEITKISRLAGQLEKLFNMLNADFFNGELETPIITIQSTPRAYAHVSVRDDAWTVKGTGRRELNVGAGTLDRDIEYTVASVLHECCHIWNIQNGRFDTSRNGTYHNRLFAETAAAHGLLVSRSEKYGWSHTEPSDQLIEWILENNIQEIRLTRNEGAAAIIGVGRSADGGIVPTMTAKSNSRRYVCPYCHTIVRATRSVNVLCGDCMESMIES